MAKILTSRQVTEKSMKRHNLQDRASSVLATVDDAYEACAVLADEMGRDRRVSAEGRNMAAALAFSIRALKSG